MGAWIALVVFLLIIVGAAYALFRGVWKDREVFVGAWRKMESFEKVSLQVGFIYYLAVPLLKAHPSKDTYVTQVSVDILSGLANALFILGALAFLKHGHELYKEKRKSTKRE